MISDFLLAGSLLVLVGTPPTTGMITSREDLLEFAPATLLVGQPPANPATGQETLRQQYAMLAAVRKEVKEWETTQPQKAIDRYQKFWEDNPKLLPAVSAEVCTIIADLYYTGLKNTPKALEVCDWAIGELKTSHERIRPVTIKAKILVATLRTDEAVQWIEKNWSLMLLNGPNWTERLLECYETALKQQTKTDRYFEQIEGTFRRLPVYLGDESWSAGVALYRGIIQMLAARQRPADALAWAKLRFVLCPYDEESMGRSITSCQELMGMQPLAPKSVTVTESAEPGKRKFGESTNPAPATSVTILELPAEAQARIKQRLLNIAYPDAALDRDAIADRLTKLERKTEQQRIERITLQLVLGRYRAAMDEAQLYRKEMPTSPNGVKQVARVLKAADMDLNRANAFIVFAKTGKGADPIPAFNKQFPTESAPN